MTHDRALGILRDVEDGLRRTLRIGGKYGQPYYLMSFKVVARCEGKPYVMYEGVVDPISFARATGLDPDAFSVFDHFTIRAGWPLEDRSRYHKKRRVHKKMVKRYGYPVGFWYIRVVGYELRQSCIRPEMLEGRPISAEFICG